MATVTDPKSGVTASVTQCRSCRALIYWGFTASGKSCPFNVEDGAPTTISHFTTCPHAKTWSKR